MDRNKIIALLGGDWAVSRPLVEKYFAVDIWDPEANEANTLVVPGAVVINKTQYYTYLPATLEVSAVAPGFKAEMDEYYDAVLGGRKVLGVLIRGSDYLAVGFGGSRKMATVEQMVPKIRQWMAEYGYEKVFLATEDSDILAKMKKEFGRDMIALAQERLSVRNLRQGQIITEYEKEKNKDRRTKREAYERMSETFSQINNGMSEPEGYTRFGEACGIREYKKLGSYLSEYVRKGTGDLKKLLHAEAQESFTRRKAMIKVKAEEAGTRLLFPMIMMLGVVMAVVMLPAMRSFSF